VLLFFLILTWAAWGTSSSAKRPFRFGTLLHTFVGGFFQLCTEN
jgi:hypothetical protein